jgi:hypothetical protein
MIKNNKNEVKLQHNKMLIFIRNEYIKSYLGNIYEILS